MRKNQANIMSKTVIQYDDDEGEEENESGVHESEGSEIEIEPDSESEETTSNQQVGSNILENPFDNIKPSKSGKYHEYRVLIYSENPAEQLEGTRKIRELLTKERK